MKPVLALDTSTMSASVAVVGGAREVLVERTVAGHHDDLIALVDGALADAGVRLGDLAAIAVGAGPGSFTGLRIGMATAKGLCFAAGLPLWPVSSLAALALDALPLAGPDTLLVPIYDARRGEVFAGFYRGDGGTVAPLAEERVIAAGSLADAIATVRAADPALRALVLGEGLAQHGDQVSARCAVLTGARATPSATSVGRLALSGQRTDELRAGTPVYIRPSEAEAKFPAGNPGGPFADTPREKK